MGAWTVENELRALGDSEDLTEATGRLGLPTATTPREIRVCRDWWRSGTETYCLTFTIASSPSSKFIFKAFVPTPGTYSIAEALRTSLRRHAILMATGVPVPRCYGARSGTALFQYIDYDLTEFLSDSARSEEQRAHLFDRVKYLATKLTQSGFQPVDLIRDLRTNGEEVFLVDLGWDLGPAGAATDGGRSLMAMVDRWLSHQMNVAP